MNLTRILREEIARSGPMRLDRYIQQALCHPAHGYYMRRDPFGLKGDFTTAPEISQMFGELIGAWIASAWLAMGSPFATLVELGPGRGTLMKDALRVTRAVKGFHERVAIRLVECSPYLREMQERALEGAHPNISWHTALEPLPETPLLLIANEFFDALPIRQFIRTPEGYRERLVVPKDEESFDFSLAETPTDVFGLLPYPTHRDVIEINPQSLGLMRALAIHINAFGGAGLICDYGYARGTGADTLQSLKNHVRHPVLAFPGEADITAHVDFRALGMVAQKHTRVLGPEGQGAFLRQLGAEARAETLSRGASPTQQREIALALERLTSESQMGNLFKVMALTQPELAFSAGFEALRAEA